jgi:hypothetical protein
MGDTGDQQVIDREQKIIDLEQVISDVHQVRLDRKQEFVEEGQPTRALRLRRSDSGAPARLV